MANQVAQEGVVKTWVLLRAGCSDKPSTRAYPKITLHGITGESWALRHLESQCLRDASATPHEVVGRHIASEECDCGIRGSFDWRHWKKRFGKLTAPALLAEVFIWGQIHFGSTEVRAQCGEIDKLWLLPKCEQCGRRLSSFHTGAQGGPLNCPCQDAHGPGIPVPLDWMLYAVSQRYRVHVEITYPPRKSLDIALIGTPVSRPS